MVDSKQNQESKPPAVPWRLHLLVGGVGLIVIGIVIYGFHIGEQLNTLDESLIDAAMEMRLEAEAADLWYREVTRGNIKVDLKTIWQPLEQSIWRLHAILLENKPRKKLYSPLKADDTRMLFDSIQQKIAALKKSTKLVIQSDKTQGSIKQERLDYEQAIREFLVQAHQLEIKLRQIRSKNLRQFRYLHLILIGTSVILFFSISLAFHFFVQRGKKDYQTVKEAKQRLELENAERVRAETELKKAHQELEERVLRRTEELSLANDKLTTEIAERCRVEDQLQHTKSMLQEVFDGIPDSLILIDRQMVLRMINRSAAAYYNIENLEDAIGQRCYRVAGEKDKCNRCPIRDAVTRGQEISYERKGHINPERLEQVSIYPIDGNRRNSGDAIIRVTDITESRLFERQLIQREKMASLGVMVTSVAHEINNPNNFVTFNKPILKDYIKELIPIIDQFASDCPDLEFCNMPYREFRDDLYRLMDNIMNGAARISSFVANLREFSQSDADLLKTYVDFKSVVEKVIAICGKKLKRSITSIELNIPQDLPKIYTAPHAIEQVLLNLLINAAQAADKNDSRVILNISIGKTSQEHLIFEVIDNGCGIDEHSISRLFDPFYTTKMPDGGSGLGLYVCHNLIKDLEGRIEVESELGTGSKFTVILPDIDKQKCRDEVKIQPEEY